MVVYRKKYFDAHIDDLFDFITWKKHSSFLPENDYICSASQEAGQEKLTFFGKFHDDISHYPIPPIAALCSRLAEIGVRTTFVAMVSTATLIIEELEERADELEEKLSTDPFNEQQQSNNLDEWKCQYDLVVRFIDQINRCFGIVLLLISATDFIIPVLEFKNIQKYNYTNPRTYFNCLHSLLRALVVFKVSDLVASKVYILMLLWSCPLVTDNNKHITNIICYMYIYERPASFCAC